MDFDELEFEDRPRDPKGPREKRTGPRRGTVGAVRRHVAAHSGRTGYDGRWDFYDRSPDFIPVNVAADLNLPVHEVILGLQALVAEGILEGPVRADTGRPYRLLNRQVSWNGKAWVYEPVEKGRRTSWVGYARSYRRPTTLERRRERRRNARSESLKESALEAAEEAPWNGLVYRLDCGAESKAKLLELATVSKITPRQEPRPPCRKCGQSGCSGGSKGRKAQRRHELKACKGRIVKSIMDL